MGWKKVMDFSCAPGSSPGKSRLSTENPTSWSPGLCVPREWDFRTMFGCHERLLSAVENPTGTWRSCKAA